MPTLSLNKYVVSLLTSVFIVVIVYCCFDETNNLEETASNLGDTFTKEKRKFVAILFKK